MTCALLSIIHRMVGLRTVQYTFTFRIRNSFVRSIPVNYRHQYYRHELTLEKLGVKNMELKISQYCRYQTYLRQMHNVVVRNYEFRARGTQFSLGPLVLCERLRWSRGSVLAFSTQVRGFKPGRSRRIFRAKNSSARLPSEGK